jgi:hypothetical protein
MPQPSIERRLEALERRNDRVDGDKAWETSLARKVAIATLTYLVVVSYLHFVIGIDPWLNALVPVFGYLLSTLTIGLLKRAWLSKR